MRRLHFRVFWKTVLCCVVCSCTGSPLCPRSLECALAGRHFCRPGSSHCGPCLRPLVENSRGRCVVKRRHAPHTHSVKGRCSYLILLTLFTGWPECSVFTQLDSVFQLLVHISSCRTCINFLYTHFQSASCTDWKWVKKQPIKEVQKAWRTIA